MSHQYPSTAHKIADLAIGFFGTFLVGWLLYFVISVALMVLDPNYKGISIAISSLTPLLAITYWISILIIAILSRRKFLIIGVLLTLAIPLLFFGACFLIIAGMGGIGGWSN